MQSLPFIGSSCRLRCLATPMLVLGIVGTIVWQAATADTRENASPAFETVSFDELHASFAYPADWRVEFAKGKLMGSLVLTEQSDDAASAPARFTVNPVSNLMRVRFRRVSEQIDEFDSVFSATSNPSRLSSAAVRIGSYVGRALLLRTERPDRTVMLERRWYLAHDARDWLVVIRFEAPLERWDELASVRNTMFSRLVMD